MGYGDRVGTGRGNTGYPATRARPRKAEADTAKRAPEAPVGLEWVVSAAAPTWPALPARQSPPTPDPWSSGARFAGTAWEGSSPPLANKGEIKVKLT